MSQEDEKPELRIAYSPLFSLDILLDKVELIASVGHVTWLFAFRCAVRHPKGQFTYDVSGLYFELEAFERFHKQLGAIAKGLAQSAELENIDNSVSFELYLDGRHLKSKIQIRENQIEDEPTILSARFAVDYDLFVNKLHEDLKVFVACLRRVSPKNVGN